MKKIRIVGLGGSMAESSTSLAALKIAASGAEEAGAEAMVFSIRELNLPMYVPGSSDVPERARRLAEAAYEAHGLLWCSPTYHGSMSGAFKNALDWFQLLNQHQPPYLTNKVIGLISTAGGTMGLQAINSMEFVVRALRGWAVPMVIPIPNVGTAIDERGLPTDETIDRHLRSLGREMVRAAGKFAEEGVCDYDTSRAIMQS